MKRSDRGFTLIEVMVALAIVALALTAIAASMSQMIDGATTMRERTYASWIAQNKIAEFRLAGTIPKVSTTSGELDYGNSQWVWRATVSETGIDNFLRIDVSVSYPESDYVVRTVTGFVGEPITPGIANREWQTSARSGPTK
jgi:general secretion pathway protein I